MSEPRGAAQTALVLRLSVPASGVLRTIASEVAAKLAEYVGASEQDAGAIGGSLEGLLGRVAPDGSSAEVALEFSQIDGDLLIDARCEGRRSEQRYPLPE